MKFVVILLIFLSSLFAGCNPNREGPISGERKIGDGRVIKWTDKNVSVYQDGKLLVTVGTLSNAYSAIVNAGGLPIDTTTVMKWSSEANERTRYQYGPDGSVSIAIYGAGFEPSEVRSSVKKP